MECISLRWAPYLIRLQWRTDVKIDGGSLLLRLPSSARLILHQRQWKLFLVFLIIITLKQNKLSKLGKFKRETVVQGYKFVVSDFKFNNLNIKAIRNKTLSNIVHGALSTKEMYALRAIINRKISHNAQEIKFRQNNCGNELPDNSKILLQITVLPRKKYQCHWKIKFLSSSQSPSPSACPINQVPKQAPIGHSSSDLPLLSSLS